MCGCVGVCVCVRDRETERQRDREMNRLEKKEENEGEYERKGIVKKKTEKWQEGARREGGKTKRDKSHYRSQTEKRKT